MSIESLSRADEVIIAQLPETAEPMKLIHGAYSIYQARIEVMDAPNEENPTVMRLRARQRLRKLGSRLSKKSDNDLRNYEVKHWRLPASEGLPKRLHVLPDSDYDLRQTAREMLEWVDDYLEDEGEEEAEESS